MGNDVVPASARCILGDGCTGRNVKGVRNSTGDRGEAEGRGCEAFHKRPWVTASRETRPQAMHCYPPSCRHQPKCPHPQDEAVRSLTAHIFAEYRGICTTAPLPHNRLSSRNEARVSHTVCSPHLSAILQSGTMEVQEVSSTTPGHTQREWRPACGGYMSKGLPCHRVWV